MFVNNWSFKRYIQINPHSNYLTNNLPHLFFKPVNFLHESENLLSIHKSLTFTFPSILNPDLNLDSILIRQPRCRRWWRWRWTDRWYFKSGKSFTRSYDIDGEFVHKSHSLFLVLYTLCFFIVSPSTIVSFQLLQWRWGRWKV